MVVVGWWSALRLVESVLGRDVSGVHGLFSGEHAEYSEAAERTHTFHVVAHVLLHTLIGGAEQLLAGHGRQRLAQVALDAQQGQDRQRALELDLAVLGQVEGCAEAHGLREREPPRFGGQDRDGDLGVSHDRVLNRIAAAVAEAGELQAGEPGELRCRGERDERELAAACPRLTALGELLDERLVAGGQTPVVGGQPRDVSLETVSLLPGPCELLLGGGEPASEFGVIRNHLREHRPEQLAPAFVVQFLGRTASSLALAVERGQEFVEGGDGHAGLFAGVGVSLLAVLYSGDLGVDSGRDVLAAGRGEVVFRQEQIRADAGQVGTRAVAFQCVPERGVVADRGSLRGLRVLRHGSLLGQ
jgi:hypothetical protein